MVSVTTQASEAPVCYWGEGGQYGPFEIQQEGDWAGWPHFGQVLRYFRKRANLSARAFGELYGKTVNADGRAIGERRILNMELDNKVPVDIGRRKTIAQLLNIPPMLLGLAVLEEVNLLADPQTSRTIGSGQTIIKSNKTDIEKYEADIRTRWKLHTTSEAGDAMPAIVADTQQLEQLATQAKGDFLYQVQELLFSNYYLASGIASHKKLLRKAHSYSNEAVRVARAMTDPELLATALYSRGFDRLALGLYSIISESNTFVTDYKQLKAATQDFEHAKKDAHPQLKGLISLQLGRARAHLQLKHASLATLDEAADLINVNNIDDPYTRMLVTGTYSGFHEGRFLTDSAVVLNIAGYPLQALTNLNTFKQPNKCTYGKDETSRFAWADIIMAESYLELGDYDRATDYARQALVACQDLRFSTNIAIIRDLYGRLLDSPYGKSTEVKGLGEMLKRGKNLF